MKAPEPTPENLEKAREILLRFDADLGVLSLTGDNVRDSLDTMTEIIALALDEGVREERSDRLKLAEERNQLLGTEYKLRQALCPRCGPEKLEGIPRTCHMHRPREV